MHRGKTLPRGTRDYDDDCFTYIHLHYVHLIIIDDSVGKRHVIHVVLLSNCMLSLNFEDYDKSNNVFKPFY